MRLIKYSIIVYFLFSLSGCGTWVQNRVTEAVEAGKKELASFAAEKKDQFVDHLVSVQDSLEARKAALEEEGGFWNNLKAATIGLILFIITLVLTALGYKVQKKKVENKNGN